MMNSWSRAWLGAMIDMVTRGLGQIVSTVGDVTLAWSDSETVHKEPSPG